MKQTAVEWLEKELNKKGKLTAVDFFQAKEMEKQKEYETKAFWFGRGILAGRENRIAELQPETYGSKGSDDINRLTSNPVDYQNHSNMIDNFKQFSLYEHKETITSADTITPSQTEISDKPHSTITDQIDGIIFEMPFIEKMKLWELINRLVNECQTEISDEEIEKASEKANGYAYYGRPNGEKYNAFKEGWKEAIKWYREQLKQKQ